MKVNTHAVPELLMIENIDYRENSAGLTVTKRASACTSIILEF